MTSIFLDANILMYVMGEDHPLKKPSVMVLELAALNSRFFTNAEVMQEILHRYTSQRRWEEKTSTVMSLFRLLAGRIVDMTAQDVREAGGLALRYPRLVARDLIHVAIMRRTGSTRIVTADRAFDNIDGIERLDPLQVEEWAPLITGT